MTCDERLETQDPQDDLDYGWDYVKWLSTGDTVAASSWTATPAGLTLHAPTFNTTTTTVWVAGGTLNIAYVLVNHITTTAGRQRDQCFTVLVKDCG